MPNDSAQFSLDAQTRFPLKDWISSFDRFASSFATGCLLLFGGYLICDGLTQHGVYNVIAFLMASPASGVVFTLPLLVSAYLLGSVSVLLSTVAFQLCFRGYNDEYAILDRVENRGHPILSKEVADIINAKRLVLASCAIISHRYGVSVLSTPSSQRRFPRTPPNAVSNPRHLVYHSRGFNTSLCKADSHHTASDSQTTSFAISPFTGLTGRLSRLLETPSNARL
jgi:hypothetical protein